MTGSPEWLVTPAGDVMLALPGRLPAPPRSARFLSNGELSVEHDGGAVRLAPGRRVAAALARRGALVVTEFDDREKPVRATEIDLPDRAPAASSPSFGGAR